MLFIPHKMVTSSFHKILLFALMALVTIYHTTNAAPTIALRDTISGGLNGNGCSMDNYVNGKLVPASGCGSDDQNTSIDSSIISSASSTTTSTIPSSTSIYSDSNDSTTSTTSVNGAHINSPGPAYIISSVFGVVAAFAILG
ncbi:uncharacterized protein FA14DRAFT_188715 [Meira miltonrushii]|uniref:Uncharacterized protein n=1 Tax=Meira miltonrushii TaxID=1280837 RepID=A0A316VBH2_9BASI|nr:uncharacterized protein FA14DRAFT_188715 [Meira miltonrushii]PWN34634.1 hypothetical protein FA14DRAFT_188715 [Meira miltonrushii]